MRPLYISALIGALAVLGSCRDELDTPISTPGIVTLTAVTDPTDGGRTSPTPGGFGDGTKAQCLRWAFYDADGNAVATSDAPGSDVSVTRTQEGWSITLCDTEGTVESYLLWADHYGTAEANPYTPDMQTRRIAFDARKSLRPQCLTGDYGDAFMACGAIDRTAKAQTVRLVRPLCQFVVADWPGDDGKPFYTLPESTGGRDAGLDCGYTVTPPYFDVGYSNGRIDLVYPDFYSASWPYLYPSYEWAEAFGRFADLGVDYGDGLTLAGVWYMPGVTNCPEYATGVNVFGIHIDISRADLPAKCGPNTRVLITPKNGKPEPPGDFIWTYEAHIDRYDERGQLISSETATSSDLKTYNPDGSPLLPGTQVSTPLTAGGWPELFNPTWQLYIPGAVFDQWHSYGDPGWHVEVNGEDVCSYIAFDHLQYLTGLTWMYTGNCLSWYAFSDPDRRADFRIVHRPRVTGGPDDPPVDPDRDPWHKIYIHDQRNCDIDIVQGDTHLCSGDSIAPGSSVVIIVKPSPGTAMQTFNIYQGNLTIFDGYAAPTPWLKPQRAFVMLNPSTDICIDAVCQKLEYGGDWNFIYPHASHQTSGSSFNAYYIRPKW